MATIAEIIAARAGKNVATATPPPATKPQAAPAPKESIAEQIELTEAINRIDPPGKRKGGSLVLNNAPLPPDPKPIVPEEPRALAARVGEALTVLPDQASTEVLAWDEIKHAFATDLVIMSDPQPGAEHAWIALKPAVGGLRPILIHKLPFWPHPEAVNLPGEPF